MRNYKSLLNAMILFFTSIVLDLHCDDEGVPYLYVPAALWPGMADCAAALGVEAVLTWQGRSDGEFEEASIHPYLASGADLTARVVTTVELRGIADVERGFAQADADGLYRLLVARGVVADKAAKPAPAFSGVVGPLANVEMVKTPKAGAVLYDVRPGDWVKEGARLATIIFAPGEEEARGYPGAAIGLCADAPLDAGAQGRRRRAEAGRRPAEPGRQIRRAGKLSRIRVKSGQT